MTDLFNGGHAGEWTRWAIGGAVVGVVTLCGGVYAAGSYKQALSDKLDDHDARLSRIEASVSAMSAGLTQLGQDFVVLRDNIAPTASFHHPRYDFTPPPSTKGH